MNKASERWYSPRLRTEVLVARWGHGGLPVLLFPTAGGDAEECERFLMLKVLAPLIDAGRVKVYSCDSVAGRVWIDRNQTGRFRAFMQNRFDEFIVRELVPLIRTDSHGAREGIVTAGASVGAFNAVAALCRHPDVFTVAIGMSGTYDMEAWLYGDWSNDYYFCSPMHFLPNLGGPQLELLRRRFVHIALGSGRWENPEQSYRLAQVLGSKGIPNYVDNWGPEYDHDWPTWRRMLPLFLDRLTAR